MPVSAALNRYEISARDTLWRFYAVIPPRGMQFKFDQDYRWYTRDTLISTRGGASDRLLHGSFTVYYSDHTLMESGSFRYGLKTGVWKSWYTGGQLKAIRNWKNGKPAGMIREFSEKGEIVRSGRFKRALFSGFEIEKLPDGTTRKLLYENGVSGNK